MNIDRFACAMPGRVDAIVAGVQSIRDWAAAASIPPRIADLATLALEELGTNAVKYGGASQSEDALRCTIQRWADGWRIVVEDDGFAFDATAHASPDLDAPLEERRIGGLGLHMLRKLSDGFEHERVAGRNRHAIVKRIGPVADD